VATVNTVSGPVSSDDLGRTYMHEHVFCVSPEMQFHWPGYHGWDEEEAIERARVTLRRLHQEHGVDTILDPTVPGIGRNVPAVARALEGTGLNAIVATGWFVTNELPFTFVMWGMDGRIDELVRLFTHDFEVGLDGTGIKPGVIKCSTDRLGLTPDVEALLRAAARTHVKTGLPITTHTEFSNESGLMQQEIFKQEGVDLEAVVIGHCNQSNDIGYIEKLIDGGSFVGFDRCGVESPVAPLEAQLDTLAELCRRGYADHVVLSHDNVLFLDVMPDGSMESLVPDYPYGHVDAKVLPGLRAREVSEADINTMLLDNPRTFFGRTRG
jgi:phosphotriesterase-related protein